MIDEKTMVADTLAGINGELTRFGEMIPQTENKQLKQTLKQLRNACETSQEEIYQLARAHQYYVPAEKASVQEVQHVKNILTRDKLIYPLKQNTRSVHHRLRCFSLLFIWYCCFKAYHLSAIFN